MNNNIDDLKKLILSLKEMTLDVGIAITVILIIVMLYQGFINGYLKKKFKDIATNENFKELKKQLNANTKIVETVKADIQRDIWLSQQVWTKKNEAYEKVIDITLEIKQLFKKRLAQNNLWCKSLEGRHENQDEQYNALLNFTDCDKLDSFVDKLELLEEKIIAKSVFLSIEFKSIEKKINDIRTDISCIGKYINGIKAHEQKISKISEILRLKINILEEVITDICLISDKDLKSEFLS